jgi:hypothetical protein
VLRSRCGTEKPRVKTTDEEAEISCIVGRGKLREEVWQDSTGKVVRYNLAFINHFMTEVITDVFLVTTWHTGIITGTSWGKLKQ